MKDITLIAQFMGWEHKGPGWQRINDDEGTSTGFKYSTSWDCLMPVIAKIESLTLDIYDEGTELMQPHKFQIAVGANTVGAQYCVSNGCSWDTLDNNYVLYTEAEVTKLYATHHVVVQFIKWYNKNKEG